MNMKNTGLVRRIDDLGRIVIPKEIRRVLRIKDGESLEIFLDSDNIVLKKYSPIGNFEEFYKNYVDSVYDVLNENIVITDCDKVIAVAGPSKKNYIGKNISKVLENAIQNRQNIFIKEKVDTELISNYNEIISYTISPIIANGDSIGAFLIVSQNRNLTELEQKATLIASKFLGRYVEE